MPRANARRTSRTPDRLTEAEAMPPRRERGPDYHQPPAPPPVTLPCVALVDVTDEMVGLKPDDGAQTKAVRYIEAVLGYQRKQADDARRAARERLFPSESVHVEVDDAAVKLVQPTDTLSDDERGILIELRRLIAQPPARWRLEAMQDAEAVEVEHDPVRAAS